MEFWNNEKIPPQKETARIAQEIVNLAKEDWEATIATQKPTRITILQPFQTNHEQIL